MSERGPVSNVVLSLSMDVGGAIAMPDFQAAAKQLKSRIRQAQVSADHNLESIDTSLLASITVIYQIPGEVENFGDRLAVFAGSWSTADRNQLAVVTVPVELPNEQITSFLCETFTKAVEVAKDHASKYKQSKVFSFDAAVKLAADVAKEFQNIPEMVMQAERAELIAEIVEDGKRQKEMLAAMKARIAPL